MTTQQESKDAALREIFDQGWQSKLDEIRERPRGADMIPYEAQDAGLRAIWNARGEADRAAVEADDAAKAFEGRSTRQLAAIAALDEEPE